MAAPIGPGDWVEFLGFPGDGRARPAKSSGKLLRGALYRVRAVIRGIEADTGRLAAGIQVEGVYAYDAAGLEGGWPIEFFRPIYRPRADFIEALKAPVTRTPRPAKKSREHA